MSDEDLLINAKPGDRVDVSGDPAEAARAHGASGLQVPTDMVNVSVFATFKEQPADVAEKGEEYVQQVFRINKPRGAADEDVSQFVWHKVLQQATIRTVGSHGETNFYPLDRFKRFAITVSQIVGVNL
jgi:hypothetical protein